MLKIIYRLSIIIVVLSTFIYSQEQRRMAPPPGDYSFTNGKNFVEVPFDLVENRMMVKVTIGDSEFDLIFDSGMPVDGAMLFGCEKVDELNLPLNQKIQIMGAAGETEEADLAMSQIMSIPGLDLSSQMILVTKKKEENFRIFGNTDGIMGGSFFNHFIVDINYDTMIITLSAREEYVYPANKERIQLLSHSPFKGLVGEIELENGEVLEAEMTMDTGNGTAMILNTSGKHKVTLPKNTITHLAHTANKELPLKMGRVSSFRLGKYKLENIVAGFKDDTHSTPLSFEKIGNLGHQILRRFNITYDLPGMQIFISPNKKFNEPFEYNMGGTQYQKLENGNFLITNVISDSPADLSGIKKGSEITTINGVRAEKISQTKLNELMREDKTTLVLIVVEGDQENEFSLVLRRLI